MKKILIVLNYYYPYVSGVSEYARLMAEEFVKEGYEVTVVTSNHDKLSPEEIVNGVRVIRTSIWFRISKGTISPQYILEAVKQGKKADIINLHLPMLESGLLASLMEKEKVFATYHCDINLQDSLLNHLIVKVMDLSHIRCCKRAHKILVTSYDYAKNSRVVKKFADKLVESGAPAKEYFPKNTGKNSSVKKIGFCGRVVEEKGIDILIKAFEEIEQKRQDVELVIGGDYKHVAGGSIYPALRSYIDSHGIEGIVFMGKVPEKEMAAFYTSLDVLVLPSINSMEAFGMVQLEAMFCGTPVVASNLPGVRSIVATTGMGEIAECGNSQDLAQKILKVLDDPQRYIKKREQIEQKYGIKAVKNAYLKAFQE